MKIKLGNIAYAVVQMVGNKTNGEGGQVLNRSAKI